MEDVRKDIRFIVTGDISSSSGTIIGRYITGNSGIIVISGLEAGVGYIVTEVAPPQNYLLTRRWQPFAVRLIE